MSYRFEPDFFGSQSESFSLRALYGHIIERSNQATATAASVNSTGGQGTPANTTTITGTYGLGNWSLQMQTRWIDSVQLARIGGGGVLAVKVATRVWSP